MSIPGTRFAVVCTLALLVGACFQGDRGKPRPAEDTSEGATEDTTETGSHSGDTAESGIHPMDADDDGYFDDEDCDDHDANVFPGAWELCDGVDDDCDGSIDEDDAVDATTWHEDEDGDGLGGGYAHVSCEAPPGYVANGTDCDDHDPEIPVPGGEEICDGQDNDCSGQRDDDCIDTKGPGRVTGNLGFRDAEAVLTISTRCDWSGFPLILADTSGDGVGDVVVQDIEAAYLHLGPLSGTRTLEDATATLSGEIASIAAGDTNGDGYDDIVVSDTFTGPGGTVYLLSAPLSGPIEITSGEAWVQGGSPDDYLGSGLAMGDLDADGLDDLLVGASGNGLGGEYSGAVGLVRAPFSETLELGSTDATLIGGFHEAVGEHLATGDVNGDGLADVILGSPHVADYAGKAWLVLGPTTGLVELSTADAIFEGRMRDDHLGSALAAGDLDGDGLEDVVLGSPWADDEGHVYVFFGRSTGSWVLASPDALVHGTSRAIVGYDVKSGDLDGDGVQDLVTSAYHADIWETGSYFLESRVYVYPGPVAGTLELGDAACQVQYEYGWREDTTFAADDVDGNGIDDLLVSWWYVSDSSYSGNGAVWEILGGLR
jgi:hypothetical protein